MHHDEKMKDYKTIKKYIPDLIAQVKFNAFLAGMKYESFHKIVNCKICISLHFLVL